jgi:hypothetical protein
MRKKAIILLTMTMIIIAMIINACAVDDPSIAVVDKQQTTESRISRNIDEEAGVVCWTYTIYDNGSISCLSIEDTDLR